jgi:hypothetical protein
MSVDRAEYALRVRGQAASPVRGLLVADSRFRAVRKGSQLAGLEDLVLRNVSMEPAP